MAGHDGMPLVQKAIISAVSSRRLYDTITITTISGLGVSMVHICHSNGHQTAKKLVVFLVLISTGRLPVCFYRRALSSLPYTEKILYLDLFTHETRSQRTTANRWKGVAEVAAVYIDFSGIMISREPYESGSFYRSGPFSPVS